MQPESGSEWASHQVGLIAWYTSLKCELAPETKALIEKLISRDQGQIELVRQKSDQTIRATVLALSKRQDSSPASHYYASVSPMTHKSEKASDLKGSPEI
mgnify:CR=1 FL=1